MFEFFISDEHLSLALINSNSSAFPCTVVSALGDPCISKSSKILNSIDLNLDFVNSKNSHYLQLIDLIDNIEKNNLINGSVSKKEIVNLNSLLSFLSSNIHHDFSYSVEELHENLEKDLSSFKISFTSTIEKLSRYYKNIPLLENLNVHSKSENFNLAKFILNGQYSAEERTILAEIISSILSSQSDTKSINDKTLEKLKDLNMSFLNKSVNNSSEQLFETNSSFEINKLIGEIDLFGSNYTQNQVVEIRIKAAFLNKSGQSYYLSSMTSILSLQLSSENFLVLLRGNLNSDFLPCSMSRLCNLGVPYKNIYTSEKKDQLHRVNHSYSKIFEPLKSIYEEIQNFTKKPIKTKRDTKILLDLIHNFKICYEECFVKLNESHADNINDTKEMFKKDLNDSIESLTLGLNHEMKSQILSLLNKS